MFQQDMLYNQQKKLAKDILQNSEKIKRLTQHKAMLVEEYEKSQAEKFNLVTMAIASRKHSNFNIDKPSSNL